MLNFSCVELSAEKKKPSPHFILTITLWGGVRLRDSYCLKSLGQFYDCETYFESFQILVHAVNCNITLALLAAYVLYVCFYTHLPTPHTRLFHFLAFGCLLTMKGILLEPQDLRGWDRERNWPFFFFWKIIPMFHKWDFRQWLAITPTLWKVAYWTCLKPRHLLNSTSGIYVPFNRVMTTEKQCTVANPNWYNLWKDDWLLLFTGARKDFCSSRRATFPLL